MKVYADTSFLISLYHRDVNSPRAAKIVASSNPIFFLTPFSELEFTNALELRVFRSEVTRNECRSARVEFHRHVSEGLYTKVSMPPTVYDLAERISRKTTAHHGTRTLDILHVASVLLLQAEQFWTFDLRQAKLAREQGLKVR